MLAPIPPTPVPRFQANVVTTLGVELFGREGLSRLQEREHFSLSVSLRNTYTRTPSSHNKKAMGKNSMRRQRTTARRETFINILFTCISFSPFTKRTALTLAFSSFTEKES
jgi:hypothetical protein